MGVLANQPFVTMNGAGNEIVVAEDAISGQHLIVTKGAFANVLDSCTAFERDGAEMPLDQALAYERAMLGLVLDHPDAKEGCQAFLEKRPARFGDA